MEDTGANLRYTRVSRGHRRRLRPPYESPLGGAAGTSSSGPPAADEVCTDQYVYDFLSRPMAVVMRRRRRCLTPGQPLTFRYHDQPSDHTRPRPHVHPAFREQHQQQQHHLRPLTYVTHPEVRFELLIF